MLQLASFNLSEIVLTYYVLLKKNKIYNIIAMNNIILDTHSTLNLILLNAITHVNQCIYMYLKQFYKSLSMLINLKIMLLIASELINN